MQMQTKITDQEYEQFVEMLFEKSNEGILIVSGEQEDFGRILMANKAAADMHGYSVEDMKKLNISNLHTPESSAKVEEGLHRMHEGKWAHAQHEHIRKDGSRFTVDYDSGVVMLGGQKCIVSLNRDLSERKRMEEARRAREGEPAAGI